MMIFTDLTLALSDPPEPFTDQLRLAVTAYLAALVTMLGLLGLRIFEATGADIADLGEEHGLRVLRVCGKGTKVVQVPLPPAVGRAVPYSAGRRVIEGIPT